MMQQTQKQQKQTQKKKEEDYATVDALERDSQSVRWQAIRRMRESVCESDLNGLRAAFEGVSGYQLGLSNAHGDLEYMVLEDILRHNTRSPLSVLGVFFGELGVGRYMVNPTYNVCVFSLIIQLDGGGEHIESEEEAAAWSNRLIEVVRYMVDAGHARPTHATLRHVSLGKSGAVARAGPSVKCLGFVRRVRPIRFFCCCDCDRLAVAHPNHRKNALCATRRVQ
jgi:hypothetical protein